MDWSGITNNLNNGLQEFNKRYQEIIEIITSPIQSYKGGTIFDVVDTINGAIKTVGYSLLVIFCLVGIVKMSTSLQDMKRPEQIFRFFLRFAIGKAIIDFGMPIMLEIFNVGLGVVNTMASSVQSASTFTVPPAIVSTVNNITGLFEGLFPYLVSFLGNLIITAISMVILLTVYGRFFKLYMYLAIAPIPLATFAGEGTSQIGQTFIKSFMGVCLEGALIVLACIIFERYTAIAPPGAGTATGADAASVIFAYMGQNIFNMLVLLGVIKMCDRLVKEMGF